jgi:hypothetical protein
MGSYHAEGNGSVATQHVTWTSAETLDGWAVELDGKVVVAYGDDRLGVFANENLAVESLDDLAATHGVPVSTLIIHTF